MLLTHLLQSRFQTFSNQLHEGFSTVISSSESLEVMEKHERLSTTEREVFY